jgi:hypothetical protein
MPTEPVTVQPPKHPMYALTTYEIRDYRRELEDALKVLPQHAALRDMLEARLAEVLAEQESRINISRS